MEKNSAYDLSPATRERARGCFIAQAAGDALGTLVEATPPDEIRLRYPDGVRDMHDGGSWGTIAGQPTDDTEMALALARTLIAKKTFDADAVLQGYLRWRKSDPFDVGGTIGRSLAGRHPPDSQANGALMRISPLGIFTAFHTVEQAQAWARDDARLTHIHPVCQDASALFASAIAFAIRTAATPEAVYRFMQQEAARCAVDVSLQERLDRAAESQPDCYRESRGWVLVAFQNAVWQMLHAPSLEEGLIDTVMQAGDTDTNAAICGALLGAVHGIEAVPERWQATVLNCRPKVGTPNVYQPRPEEYWPVDVLTLADSLLELGVRDAASRTEVS